MIPQFFLILPVSCALFPFRAFRRIGTGFAPLMKPVEGCRPKNTHRESLMNKSIVSFARLPRVVFMVGALACLLVSPLAADASTLRYTGTGGSITGTLNGNPFTNATWSVTGTANPTNVVSGTATGIPYYLLAMAPQLTLTTGSSTLSATLLASGSNGQMGVFSGDYSGFTPGLSLLVFTDINTLRNGIGLQGNGLYNNLQSPFVGSGVQVDGGINGTYNTDAGPLVITANNSQASSFSIAAVPEPSTYAIALTGLACGGYSMFRRRRAR
jgi:hypothetical protein